MKEEINKIPTEVSENESDDYDYGRKDFKEECLLVIQE
jgi:hypothetical protein